MEKRNYNQFFKFSVVGFLNTSLDFGVLNFLSYLTGIYSGFNIIFLNSASFFIAIVNSYFWNKYWTFNQSSGVKGGEFLKFFVIGFGGLILNSFLVYAITTFIPPFDGLTPQLLENLAKILATIVSLFWNFIGLKFFVFKA
jgi:putative flippase GtrA